MSDLVKISGTDFKTIKKFNKVTMEDISSFILQPSSPSFVWQDTFENGDNWGLDDTNAMTRFANSSWDYYSPKLSAGYASLFSYTGALIPWHLDGDFEFIVDFSITSIVNNPSGFDASFILNLFEYAGGKGSANTYISIYGNGAGGLEYTDLEIQTEWGTLSTGGFRFRAVRSGTTLKMYTWHNNRWEWNGDTDGYTSENTWDLPVEVSLKWGSASDTIYILGKVDTFTLVSGTRVLI